MKSRDDHEKTVAVVASIVYRWDPYGLLESGAPRSEFDAEIGRVVAQVPEMREPKDATLALSKVFSAAFEPHLFTPAACASYGEMLFRQLVEAGLVQA